MSSQRRSRAISMSLRIPMCLRMLRPAVPVVVSSNVSAVLGVLGSGSPASVADATMFDVLGVDVENDEPLYEIPLTVGRRFRPTPVFEVRLWSRPPESAGEPLPWPAARPARVVRPVPDPNRRHDVQGRGWVGETTLSGQTSNQLAGIGWTGRHPLDRTTREVPAQRHLLDQTSPPGRGSHRS